MDRGSTPVVFQPLAFESLDISATPKLFALWVNITELTVSISSGELPCMIVLYLILDCNEGKYNFHLLFTDSLINACHILMLSTHKYLTTHRNALFLTVCAGVVHISTYMTARGESQLSGRAPHGVIRVLMPVANCLLVFFSIVIFASVKSTR